METTGKSLLLSVWFVVLLGLVYVHFWEIYVILSIFIVIFVQPTSKSPLSSTTLVYRKSPPQPSYEVDVDTPMTESPPVTLSKFSLDSDEESSGGTTSSRSPLLDSFSSQEQPVPMRGGNVFHTQKKPALRGAKSYGSDADREDSDDY